MTRSGATACHIEVAVSGGHEVWATPQVSKTIEQAIALAPKRLIIDLANCTGIDASGIALLLDVHRRAITEGGVVMLRNPCERIRRNLRLSKVDRVLRISRRTPAWARPSRAAARMARR